MIGSVSESIDKTPAPAFTIVTHVFAYPFYHPYYTSSLMIVAIPIFKMESQCADFPKCYSDVHVIGAKTIVRDLNGSFGVCVYVCICSTQFKCWLTRHSTRS